MSKFTVAMKQNGLLQKIPNSDKWIVKGDFYWFVDYNTKEIKIVVPKGFISNMGSIPRLLWIFFDKTKYISFLIHDYLYSKKGDDVTRKGADLILLEALNVEGSSWIERTCIYIGVRCCGRLFYKKK